MNRGTGEKNTIGSEAGSQRKPRKKMASEETVIKGKSDHLNEEEDDDDMPDLESVGSSEVSTNQVAHSPGGSCCVY